MKRLFALLLLAVAHTALGQDESPAVNTEQPAVSTEQSAPVQRPATSSPIAPPRLGTTIVGEQDTALGLYIMPWRSSAAQGGLDRPARLLNEALGPVDLDVFRRQVEYYRALSEHLQKTGRATP